ncbi:MAG: anthranilate synthase component I [Actinomycetota bacterium]
MNLRPSRDEFLDLATHHDLIPVSTVVLGDRETPVGAFEALTGDGPAFLLESVEGGDRWGRWSFLGWDPLFILSARDGEVAVSGADIDTGEGDPLARLEAVVGSFSPPILPGLPPLHTGLVGYLGYDTVRYVERLPARPPDDRALPEMLWQAVGTLGAFDRFAQQIHLIRNVIIGDDPGRSYDDAVGRLEAAAAALEAPRSRPALPVPSFAEAPWSSATMSAEEYRVVVERVVGHITAGDAFQVVPSIRFEVDFTADPFAVYRALRLLNPSPYMFFLRHPGLAIAGSSPELMVRAREGRVYSRPIAGTRRRGNDPAEDSALAEELLADPKERAEHVMLVDLARNDLGRVCEYGSVSVDDLMVIERYSHVMHIVSGVSGTLRPGVGPVDVLRATFPHGTVTGAPKVRAMQIIDSLEPVARGPYAGAVGYVDFSGNLDTAIALRTMVAANGKAWVQAGAGVVADSRPQREYEECGEKAAAVLAAIAAAGHV